jgi:hypothetical protein
MKGGDLRETGERAAQAVKSGQPRKPWRDRLYGRLKVSVRTIDLIIIIAVVLLAATLILGVLTARR